MAIVVRKIPQIAIDFIQNEEGVVLHQYRDIANYLTICIGHLIRKHESFPDEMTEEQCKDLLHKDLLLTAVSIMRLIRVPLYDSQYAALLSWTYNLGSGALQASTLRSRLNREDYNGVPEEMRKWVWAGGKKIRGLIRRREREAALFEAEENYNEDE